ncbi:MAG: discoidin domain-containing protein [Ignavibacteriales bacterium]|nr:discoidin domain-containing protein [Ignavibacteriales bacterium]
MNFGTDTIAQQKDLDPTNIAQFKPTQQSSVFEAAHSNRAVDGNTDGNWENRSVSHTNGESNPWWQVDLLQSYDISEIIIYNRTDCCSERLDNFTVRVSESPFNGNSGGEVVVDGGKWLDVNNAAPFGLKSIPIKSIPVKKRGRYIRIHLNNQGYLSLAEIVVRGTKVGEMKITNNTNLALGKKTESSSIGFFSPPHLANDGDLIPQGWDFQNWNYGSVFHSNLQDKPWWQVDLGGNFIVSSVKIYNRTDFAPERLSNFDIFVTSEKLDHTRENVFPLATESGSMGKVKAYQANQPSAGRYVRVQLHGTNYLSLAEVQVFGEEVGDLYVGNNVMSNAYWRYSTAENFGSTPQPKKFTVTKTVSEGFNFERTVENSDKGWFELGTKITAEKKFLGFKGSVEVYAKGGAEWAKSASEKNSENVQRSIETSVEEDRSVEPGKRAYWWKKFVVNEIPITYKKNGENYSWTAVLNTTESVDEKFIEIPAGTKLKLLEESNNYWVSEAQFNKIYEEWVKTYNSNNSSGGN